MNNYSSSGPRVQITGKTETAAAEIGNQQAESSTSRGSSARGKFVKSKSSPSSLTTHKFGLRPTPSPPRLIIDHQTGDIVESYPEHPVYLRTFQPIEVTTDNDDDDDDQGEDDDTTQNQIEDSLATQSSHHPIVTEPAVSLTEQEDQRASICPTQQLVAATTIMSSHNTSRPTNQNQHHLHRQSARPPQLQQQQQPAVIPPPHAGKGVYFDTPGPSLGGSLFDQRIGSSSVAPVAETTTALSSRERAQASFRRALNTIADAERTDIAIVTEPDDGPTRLAATGQIRVTATSAAKGNALLAAQQQQLHQPRYASNNASKLYGQPPAVTATRDNRKQVYQPIEATRAVGGTVGAARKGGPQLMMQHHQLGTIDRAPTLEESSLYNFCFNLRVLLVILLSSSIIYLLTVPLHSDCVRYRPTHTYVSLIASSVNLICIIIFSLFWYCRGITRTLYQNISASAFIVTFYSILVCVNLALAILFFFIDTCHFQKLLATRSALSELQVSPGSGLDDFGDTRLVALNEDAPSYSRQRQEARLALEAIESIEHLLNEKHQHQQRDDRRHSRRQVAAVAVDDGDSTDNDDTPPRPDPTVIDDTQFDPNDPALAARVTTSTTTPSSADLLAEQYGQEQAHVPKVSPWEAFWEYLKDQAREMRRSFLRFLVTYDLKFIGALHALLAACFQYLAMKVAVVRSFFSAQASLAYSA